MAPTSTLPAWLLAGSLLLAGPAARGQEAAPPQVLRLRTLIINDPNFRMEAMRLLVPADWRAGGRVHWRLHPQYPAAVSVVAYNPAGAEGVAFYPMVPFVAGVRHLPPGGYYLGNEVRPYPGGVRGYVEKYLLPRYRPDIRNYRVLAVEAMPELARASLGVQDARSAGIRATARAGRVRIAYVADGRAVEEEYYVILDSLYIVNLHYWGAEWASSVRAEPGRLAEVRKIHQAMLFSVRPNLRWFNRVSQVAQMVEADIYRQQARVMALSAYLARTQEQIRQSIMARYEYRQAVLDRVHANFSRYIRGVDLYQGPYSRRPVELPSGYRQAWTNGLGDYVMSNDLNYNPNRHLNGTWHRLTPAR